MTDAEKIRVLREALQSSRPYISSLINFVTSWVPPEEVKPAINHLKHVDAILSATTEPAPREPQEGEEGWVSPPSYDVFRDLGVERPAPRDSSAPGETWQPITTAPIDRWIWVYVAAREGLSAFQCVCHWHPDAGFCCDELRFPTHWRELRDFPPPQPAAGEGGADQ